MYFWKKLKAMLKQIPPGKLWELARAIITLGVTKLIILNPNGMWGFSWNDLLWLLAILGIYKGADAARHVTPDKYIPIESWRTGDGSAPVSAKLALKLEQQQVAETAVKAMSDKPLDVKAEVTTTEPSVTPPPKTEP